MKKCAYALLLTLASCNSVPTTRSALGTMIAEDKCPKDNNEFITLEPGVSVQMYQSIAPVSQKYKDLPSDSPLSQKLNLTYVKALSGPHVGEYCWASTVNVQASSSLNSQR